MELSKGVVYIMWTRDVLRTTFYCLILLVHTLLLGSGH